MEKIAGEAMSNYMACEEGLIRIRTGFRLRLFLSSGFCLAFVSSRKKKYDFLWI